MELVGKLHRCRKGKTAAQAVADGTLGPFPRRLAAEGGRSLRFGLRTHIIIRDSEDEAWRAADELIRYVDDDMIARQQKYYAGMDSVGQQRMSALHGGRRDRLARALRPGDALQLSEAWHGDSERRFDDACRSGWEGLIAKRAAAPYVPGRSRDWLKLKTENNEEFVVTGYTRGSGRRAGTFGSLVLAVN